MLYRDVMVYKTMKETVSLRLIFSLFVKNISYDAKKKSLSIIGKRLGKGECFKHIDHIDCTDLVF